MNTRVDRLLRSRALNRVQHATATWLREAWETASLTQAENGNLPIIADEQAWQRYSQALAALPRDERRVVVAVAIYDEGPVAWGRRWNCDGLAMLRRALDQLTKRRDA